MCHSDSRWLCSGTEYDDVEALQTNISLGDLWLLGMAKGAQASGRTVRARACV